MKLSSRILCLNSPIAKGSYKILATGWSQLASSHSTCHGGIGHNNHIYYILSTTNYNVA